MPIHRITERGLRFPRLGSIRKGEQIPVVDKETNKPKRNASGEIIMRPIERPWFVFSADSQLNEYIPVEGMKKKELAEAQKEHAEEDYRLRNELLERIYNAYGTNQITQLNVFLPYPEADKAFSFWLEAYAANQLVARSDGVQLTFLFDTTTSEVLIRNGFVVRHSSNPKSVAGKLVEPIAEGGILPYQENMVVAATKTGGEAIGFRAVGRLNVFIPELWQLATWMVFTGAWSDIESIYSAVDIIGQLSRVTSRPANTFPLILKRVPHEMKFEDENGKTKRTTKHFIEATVVSDSVKGLLTEYENTPFQFQLVSNVEDEDEENFDEVIEPEEVPTIEGELNEPTPQPEDDENLRPFAPEFLKNRVKEMAEAHKVKGTGMRENYPNILAAQLNKIFGNDTDRYTFTAWIFDKSGSTRTLSAHEILALMDWLNVFHFGNMPDEGAVIEARMALDHINKTRGQIEYPI